MIHLTTRLTKKFISVLKLIAVLIFSFTGYSSYGQDTSQDQPFIPTKLFSSEEVMDVTILFDYKELIKGKSKEPEYDNAELIYSSPEGDKDTFDIKIKPRGYSRRVYSFCAFPPIMLNFKKKAVANTIFEGQDKLKLVAFCKDTDINEQYNLQEYLIYKVYNLFTPYSFKVRMVNITYKDRNEKKKPITRFGFIIESQKELALRNNGEMSEKVLKSHDRCDRTTIDQLTVFQYLIGNTDWWVTNFHNIKLLQVEGKLPIPIPFDFDYAGVVGTPYAQPDPQLDISSVKERLFRGFCRFPGEYENTFEVFNEKKDAIYEIYSSNELLTDKQKKNTLTYYDNFYKTINDPKQVKVKIYDACQLKHKHMHVQ